LNSYDIATGSQNKELSAAPVGSQVTNYVQFGVFHLDVERRELYKDGLRVKVQSKVLETLLILVENPGQIIPREMLRTRLWPADTEINYDANVNTTVNKLRHALGDSHDRPLYVETVPRRGYTFIANTQFVEQPWFAAPGEKGRASGSSGSIGFLAAKNFFGAFEASRLFTAGAIALFVGAMLFGAAVVLFAHRSY
jgi:DNA-binding winged helix-turn-helix (wHTH) protein